MISKIQELLDETARQIPFASAENSAVSAANVGWHIEHLALSTRNILIALGMEKTAPFQQKFNIKRLFVFTVGKIPRGKGKAPQAAMPKPDIELSEAYLSTSVKKAVNKLKDLEKILDTAYFAHPFFGHLNKKKTLKFIAIHLQHHLAIINDIKKQNQQ